MAFIRYSGSYTEVRVLERIYHPDIGAGGFGGT